MKNATWSRAAAISVVLSALLGFWKPLKADAQDEGSKLAVDAPKFQVDPFWPKPLPDRWVTGEVGGVCVDAQDHVFVVTRGNLVFPKEPKMAKAAPAVIEFDADGNVINSWGNRDLMPKVLHGCFIDYQGNVWIAGNHDGIVQKYSHDGKMLLQIGTKGKFDSTDGTDTRPETCTVIPPPSPMNSSREFLGSPTSVAVDPTNGDVYIADGYGNRRVVVFDSAGHFLRQWGRQGTMAEVDAGVGGVFLREVHCVAIGNDGLVYACDRFGGRIEVFDKMGNFQRNILVESKTARLTGIGSACWLGFSPDPNQKFMYVGDCGDAEVRVMDRATGRALSSFGGPGLQAGEFEDPHSLAVNHKGDIFVGECPVGRRVQKFRLIR
jgi:DNA-binding beta-propeller fold protein YncE